MTTLQLAMNNKNQKIKIKNLNFTQLVIGLTIVALLIAAILRVITPQEGRVVSSEFVVKNYDGTQSSFKKVKFSGISVVLPEYLNVYGAINNSGLADQLAMTLVNEYQMIADLEIPNYWVGEEFALAKNNYEQNYVFNGSYEESQSDLPIILNEAIAVCRNFYSKYNILVPLVVREDDVLYFNSADEHGAVSPKEATYLHIPMTYELDGYPVFYQNKNNYPFFCRVDNLYELKKVVFKDFFQEFQQVKQLKPISIDQAVKNIENGNASIISAQSQITPIVDLDWIEEADLYKVEIDYRYDEKLKIAYPFYKFGAKLTNSSGINIDAIVITPAIKTAKE